VTVIVIKAATVIAPSIWPSFGSSGRPQSRKTILLSLTPGNLLHNRCRADLLQSDLQVSATCRSFEQWLMKTQGGSGLIFLSFKT
jgi:hypothetical protein